MLPATCAAGVDSSEENHFTYGFLEQVREAANGKPHAIITSGETGSGKTTKVFGMLHLMLS